jgi:putative ATP-binding cassette transporter
MIDAMRKLGSLVRDTMRLAMPYFRSDERWVARGLLAAIVALNLFQVYLNVLGTYWQKIAYNALQDKNAGAFWSSMFTYRTVHGFPYLVPGFAEIAVVTILAGVYAFYLNQMLQIRWRRWLTAHFTRAWLERGAHYRISLTARAGTPLDNPDQRIAEDVSSYVTSTLSIGISFLSNIVTLLSFVGVLWIIVPPLHLGGVVIHGYLVWFALLYSIIGTYITQVIGRRLVPLTYRQQQVEADFRFNLVHVREHTEQIALSGGESQELVGLNDRFAAIYTNWWSIMKRSKALNFFTIGFAQVAIIVPFIVAVPSYFAGVFNLGVVIQISSIFGSVQGALSWFVTSYSDLVDWRATVQRLVGFEHALRDAHAADASALATTEGGTLRLEDLDVTLPSGEALLAQDRLEIASGTPVALTGASGMGKSTLFRVVAGVWPFVRGRLTKPSGTLMFLPQRPYIPLGSLKRAVVYPLREDEVADESVREALTAVGLEGLNARLDEVDAWALRLSGGEQQRLALARALIVVPDWLFLDEAMSALDDPRAASLFAMLRTRLPKTQIVSVTHQKTLEALHPRRMVIVAEPDGRPRLEIVEPPLAS